MKKSLLQIVIALVTLTSVQAQGPVVTHWLQNNTVNGTYYVLGNSTAIDNGILVNCQKVEYSADYVYITSNGIPAYATGPFLDNNPSQAESQNVIFKIPLSPIEETGAKSSTVGGNCGVFINGVALFDYRDGVAWNTATNALCGGPGNSPCPGGPMASMDWNRDAIPAEMGGFDCSKGHPAMGNYHHHQNPSAFKIDLTVLSNVCNLYDADGLYKPDSVAHSPLIGFAYDGFPIYGAYGFKNNDGTGGITRIKSGYDLRSIAARTHHADGSDVDDGPAVDATYYLGYFREDYEFATHSSDEYLDIHNGRFCLTPEYPKGTYAYFATVDENWNSAYPYVIGPSFYGEFEDRIVNTVSETTTTYTSTTSVDVFDLNKVEINIFPNPASSLIAIQMNGLVTENVLVELFDLVGKKVKTKQINKGQTIAYFDTQVLYAGQYFVRFTTSKSTVTKSVVIAE